MISQEKRIERIHKDFKILHSELSSLDFYQRIFRVFGNKICGNVEGRCNIIFAKKQGWYRQAREENKNVAR